MDPTPVFETERTVVRPWADDEVDRLFDILRRDEVARWLGTGHVMRSRDEAVTKLADWRRRSLEPVFGFWAVVERGRDLPAGTVVLKPLPNGDGEVEVGWHLHPDSWGRGLASEAARGALRHAFDVVRLDEVWAVTAVDNAPSQRVCRAIGMTDAGVTHDRWYDGELQLFHIRADAHAAIG